MKILFVNDYGYVMGGAEVYALEVARALAERGHEVRWLTSSSRGGGELALVPPSISAFHDDLFCNGVTGGSRLSRGIDQWANLSAERAMRRALRDFRPDIVHVHGFLGRLSPRVLAPLDKTPAIATLHTYKAICPKGTKVLSDESSCQDRFGAKCVTRHCLSPAFFLHEWTKRRVSGDAFRNLRLLLAPSSYLEARFREERSDLPLELFPYGTSVQAIAREKRASRQVLFVGRLSKSKGVDRLVEAFAKIAKAHSTATLAIAGDGPERENLERLVEARGLHAQTRFLGACGREEIAALHAESACAVVPSRWPEVSGITVMESLAFGTPVVAPRVGGIPELVTHGEEGWLVDPGDVTAMARAIARLLEDDALRRQLGENARRRADAFRLEAQLPALEMLYERARSTDVIAGQTPP